MKKSTRKVINYLSKYVGHEVLRTRPAGVDWSYTSDDPILLVGFTSDGCMRVRDTGNLAIVLGKKERVLPICFTDRNWITYKKALRGKGNKLNKWRGKKIIPTAKSGVTSSDETFILVSASKHHIVLLYKTLFLEETQTIYNLHEEGYADWELAE